MRKLINFALLSLIAITYAYGQSSPNFTQGQVPTVAQWNSYFAAKQDYLGYTPVNRNGDTMTGPLITAPSSLTSTGLNVPVGVAPSSPNNGDMWSTAQGWFFQTNGVTAGPVDGQPLFNATTSAAGSTTLVVTSAAIQELTGSTTQTFVLPVVSTLWKGWNVKFLNDSSGTWTINSSGGNLVKSISAGASATVYCVLLTGTAAASWHVL